MRSVQKPTVLFINRVYPPYKGATGRVLRDLAQAFAQEGWAVTVVTSGSKSEKLMDGTVSVIRVKASQNKSLWAYATVWTKLLWKALLQPRNQMVVTLTDPPLIVVAGRIVAKMKNSAHIHWCQDLYPDVMPALGLNIPNWGMNILRRLARKSMRSCDKVVVIGRCMARHLAHTGFDMAKVSVIPNWPDYELTPMGVKARNKKSLTMTSHAVMDGKKLFSNRPFFLDESPKFRVLYSGNLGRAHPISTIMDAAALLQETNPEIEFVFAGDGAGFEKIAQLRSRMGLDNIRLLPPQPLSRLKDLMEGGDLHLISMRHEVSGMIVPSKLYAALAAGRPCIFIGPDMCEAAKVIQEFGAGAVIGQGQSRKLAQEILNYRNDGDMWFAAQRGALKASEKFVPTNSISSWINGAKETIRSRVA